MLPYNPIMLSYNPTTLFYNSIIPLSLLWKSLREQRLQPHPPAGRRVHAPRAVCRRRCACARSVVAALVGWSAARAAHAGSQTVPAARKRSAEAETSARAVIRVHSADMALLRARARAARRATAGDLRACTRAPTRAQGSRSGVYLRARARARKAHARAYRRKVLRAI